MMTAAAVYCLRAPGRSYRILSRPSPLRGPVPKGVVQFPPLRRRRSRVVVVDDDDVVVIYSRSRDY